MTALTTDQEERLARWRNAALQRMPYFAPILFAMQPQHTTQVATMSVDRAWRLVINFDAPQYANITDAAEDLLHECGHIISLHAERADTLGTALGDKDWNLSCDMEWNDDLVAAGCSTIEATGVLPAHISEDDYETAEHYYKAIKALRHQQDKQSRKDNGSGTGGTPTASDQQPTGKAKETPTEAPFSGCGAISGGEPGPFGTGLDGDTPSPLPGVDAETRDAVLESAATLIVEAQKTQGNVPAGLVTQAEHLLAPAKVPWRRVLAAAVRQAAHIRPSGEDWSYRRPSRRRANVTLGSGRRVIFPSPVHRIPKVAVVRDTSGSMSAKDLQTASVEIEGIATAMGIKGDDFLIIDTDMKAYTARKYQGPSTTTTVTGRGGTDMRVGIDAALTHKPDAVVVITDGYTDWPDTRPPGVSLVACIVADTAKMGERVAKDVPDFFRTVVVDLSD